MSDAFDQLQETTKRSNAGKSRWPRMPGHDADLGEIRSYLTQAAVLPNGWVVESVERHGRYGTDPMTVTIRTPGEAPNIRVRFRNQRDASKPAALRGAFMEATGGACRMRYPKTPEASDFHGMLCALATVADDSTVADETQAWVIEYVERADPVTGHTLRPEGRYDALQALRGRRQFTKVEALRWINEDLPPGARWALFADAETEEQWIRVGEFATYIRHVVGVGRLGQHTLDALITEIGGERERWEADRRDRGFDHPQLLLYRVPSDLAIPIPTRMSTT